MTPKQPYIDWANGFDEDGVKIGYKLPVTQQARKVL
jgi:hypothetical protein